MHIGIFGGSFDPPHLAHLIVAEHVREAAGLDRVLWVPAYRSPHKADRPGTPPHHRLAMVRLAVAGNPAFAVSDEELRREGLSYTVDTVAGLQAAHPDDAFALILGGDSFRSFARWHRPEAIVARVPLLVYDRAGGPADPTPFDRHARFVEAPLLPFSSTDIRARLRAGRSARYLVPDAVLAYIEAHGLYRTEAA